MIALQNGGNGGLLLLLLFLLQFMQSEVLSVLNWSNIRDESENISTRKNFFLSDCFQFA